MTAILLSDYSLREFFQSWHSVLWIGMAALVVAQFVLGRTRWSESRPIALCVTLSVAAHLILIIYAYGARFEKAAIGRSGNGQGEFVLGLNWLDDEPSPDDLPDDDLQRTEPLEEASQESPDVVENPTTEPATAADSETELAQPDHTPLVNEMTAPTPPTTEQQAIADLAASATVIAESALSAADSVEAAAESARTIPMAAPAIAAVAVAATNQHERAEPLRAADHKPVPKVYQNRMAENRISLVLQFGGGADTEAAVQAALDWLAANQASDGRWDADAHGAGKEARILGQDRGGAGAKADTGITGLALLALMAGGETHLKGKHREAVQHGLEFLLRSQGADGNLAGEAELYARMYCHGIASLAISEAFAITGDQRLKPYVQRAIAHTLACQHPTTGGWRYLPGDTGDMSQFGWQLLALKSAELGGFEISPLTRSAMERFLESVTSGRDRGLAAYRPGERVSRTMTAEALLCRYFLKRCTPAQAEEAAKFLLEEQPGSGAVNFYYWYYATLALHQMQGDEWRTWNERLKARLLSTQRSRGAQAGSWDADPVWGNYGGRVFSTALGALCLESYYRYLPVTEMARKP